PRFCDILDSAILKDPGQPPDGPVKPELMLEPMALYFVEINRNPAPSLLHGKFAQGRGDRTSAKKAGAMTHQMWRVDQDVLWREHHALPPSYDGGCSESVFALVRY